MAERKPAGRDVRRLKAEVRYCTRSDHLIGGAHEIVGQPTAGANGNVNPLNLPGGYRIGWTGMRVIKHDESQHHIVGIQPTVPVERTLEGVRAGRDELLETALEVIRAADRG